MICYDLQLTLKMQVWRGWTEKTPISTTLLAAHFTIIRTKQQN